MADGADNLLPPETVCLENVIGAVFSGDLHFHAGFEMVRHHATVDHVQARPAVGQGKLYRFGLFVPVDRAGNHRTLHLHRLLLQRGRFRPELANGERIRSRPGLANGEGIRSHVYKNNIGAVD